jgi:hypothetical protein
MKILSNVLLFLLKFKFKISIDSEVTPGNWSTYEPYDDYIYSYNPNM